MIGLWILCAFYLGWAGKPVPEEERAAAIFDGLSSPAAARMPLSFPVRREDQDATLKELLKRLKDQNHREEAVEALGEMGAERVARAAPALIRILRSDGNYWVRSKAALALGRMPQVKKALKSLADAAFEDEENIVRVDARDSLAAIYKSEPLLLEREMKDVSKMLLRAALSKEKGAARAYRAIRVLQAIASVNSEKGTEMLMQVVQKGTPQTQALAVEILGGLGPLEDKTAAVLLPFLKNEILARRYAKGLGGYREVSAKQFENRGMPAEKRDEISRFSVKISHELKNQRVICEQAALLLESVQR